MKEIDMNGEEENRVHASPSIERSTWQNINDDVDYLPIMIH